MSDEPSSSTAAHQTTSDNLTRNESRAGNGRDAAHERRQRNKRLFNKKREAFLADLMRNVDILIYAELSAIYYMDCSFLRFLMRAFVQFVLLTPKPSIFPEPPQSRPIGMIIGTNILCFILHAYFARPEAGEATRGYLHGGLAMDFIGQKGPTSKLHLLCLDVLVLLLQVLHIGILTVKKKARAAAESPTTTTTSAPRTVPTAPSQQNLDFEERGQLRSDHQQVDIELQELNSDGATARQHISREPDGPEEDTGGEERQRLLQTTETPRSDRHIFDAFNSGEIMVADLNLYKIMKEQFMLSREAVENAQSASGSTSGSSSASFAGTGLNFRIRIGNRILGV